MNTEQLKTAEEFLNHHYVHDNMMTQQKGWVINAMNSFASQESKLAVEKDRESRWISVKERLPEDGQMVLIQSTDNAMFPVVSRYRKSHKLQFIIPYRSDLDVKNVTHWHSLPEPPKL